MMHADSEVEYGRFGTIDPGDIIVLRSIRRATEVTTLVEGGDVQFGKPGDVLVYYPANDRARSPILHRAVAYVEVEGQQGSATYSVRWGADPCEGGGQKAQRGGYSWCEYGPDGIYIPSVPIQGFGSTRNDPNPYRPLQSGFITKGDNPVTNTQTDQNSGLSSDERGDPSPVQIEWIEGKAVAEVPWLGLSKMERANRPNEFNPPAAWEHHGNAYAPHDLWVMRNVAIVAPYVIGAVLGAVIAGVLSNRRRATQAQP